MADYSYSGQMLDGFDVLYKRTEDVLKSTADIGNWMKKIAAAEDSYSKAMLKLTTSSKSKKRPGVSSSEMGTMRQAWDVTHSQLEASATQHGKFATAVQTEVATRIASFVADKTTVRKKLVMDGTKITNELRACMTALQKAKSNYDSKCKDADAAQQAFQKARSDGNIKPKKLNELNGKASKALDVANQADKEYQRALQRANEKQQRFYSHEMPSLLEIFQHFEEERLQFLKEMFERVAELFSDFPPLLESASEQLTLAAKEINVKTDIQEYIEASRTGVTPPAPIQYVPYESDNPNFGAVAGASSSSNTATVTGVGSAQPAAATAASAPMASNPSPSRAPAPVSDAPKEYGLSEADQSLPPAEKAAKIQSQLSELRESIKAETKSKKGLEKLVKFYAKDPVAQEKAIGELEDQKQKIAHMKEVRSDLESQLTDLNSGGGSSSVPVQDDEDDYDDAAVCVQARGLYDYEATNDTELSFQENDLLTITEQDESGWWFAELNGKSGFVPRNYVELA